MLNLNKRSKTQEALNLYNRWQNNILHRMRKAKGEVGKNASLLINYENIDKVEKQNPEPKKNW